MPPWATSRSAATPRAGLAVTPLLPSEPPQLVPRMSFAGRQLDALDVVDLAAAARRRRRRRPRPSCRCRRTPGSSAPVGCFATVSSCITWPLLVDQVRRLARLAAEADEDVRRRRSGARANPASVRSSCLWSGPSYCIPQPPLWVIAHDAVDVREILQQPATPPSAMYLLVDAEQLTVLMIAT